MSKYTNASYDEASDNLIMDTFFMYLESFPVQTKDFLVICLKSNPPNVNTLLLLAKVNALVKDRIVSKL